MDRRIRKSEEAITKAFVELIKEKRFEQITINDIANRADVNRGTVYLHYRDKFDLLDQCIQMQLTELFGDCLGEDSDFLPSKTSMLRALQYLEQHISFYNRLLGNEGVPAFRNYLMNLMVQSLSEQMERNALRTEVNQELFVQFLASAIVGVLELWISRSMPYPAEVMVDQLWAMLGCFPNISQPGMIYSNTVG